LLALSVFAQEDSWHGRCTGLENHSCIHKQLIWWGPMEDRLNSFCLAYKAQAK